MVKFYIVEVDEVIDLKIYDQLLLLISEDRCKKINGFKFDIDKKLSLYSEILVRYLACHLFNIKNVCIKFKTNNYGKPYIDSLPNFYFNISHTRNAFVIGISDNSIGVDIEKEKDFDIKIAKRFFTSNELNYILDFEESETNKYFYVIWTKKEAYIKYMGKGMSIPLKSFDVVSDDLSSKIYTFKVYDYIVSVCCDKCNDIEIREDMIVISESEFLEFALEI
jgi:phosphopantethiene--protein transferase domain